MAEIEQDDKTLTETLDAVAVALKSRGLQYEADQVAAGAARIRSLAEEIEDAQQTLLEMGEQMDMQDIE